MAEERILTAFDLAIIEQRAKEFSKRGKAKLQFQIAKLDLRSKAEVFQKIKDRNQVKKQLEDSITSRLKKSFGEVQGIRFDYNWYGLFFNTGAKNAFGKGVTLPALQWQAAALNPETDVLFAQMADFYADLAIKNIEFKNTK